MLVPPESSSAVLVMMMMQYTNCVVKAHKVQTVKLTLYKYNLNDMSYAK